MTGRRALAGAIHEAGITVPDGALELLETYLEELERWSKTHALISRRDPDEALKQTLDSLLLLKTGYPGDFSSMLDVGSGAGFPALPVKIFLPALPVRLLEPNHKKASFLKHVIRRLGLAGAEVDQKKAEAAARESARYGLVTSKALAGPEEACRLALPLTSDDGILVIYASFKGVKGEDEQIIESVGKSGGELVGFTDLSNPVTKRITRLIAVRRPGRAETPA